VFKGADVIGVDISPTAIETCKKEVSSSTGNVKFIEADFFKSELGTFDLIFDQTFFCAIIPQMRNDWGKVMSGLVRKDGHLLTVIYPLPLDPENVDTITGPPFEVTFSAYENALRESFVCVKKWSNEILPLSNLKRKGREESALWRHK
jgi:methyl halide transferase